MSKQIDSLSVSRERIMMWLKHYTRIKAIIVLRLNTHLGGTWFGEVFGGIDVEMWLWLNILYVVMVRLVHVCLWA